MAGRSSTHRRTSINHIAPAVILFFLAPFIAEYLLGDLPITMLSSLLVLAPMYGGGALLIREVVRRTGRGWPTIIVLGLAYGALEEGITTQSLFNPDYLNAHLLDYGFVPALGIAIPWTIFVLTIHTIWSISVPIALVEALFSGRRTTPWLGRTGLAITCILFAIGIIATTVVTRSISPFIASIPQLAGVGIAIVILVAAAFRMRPAPHRPSGPAPNPWAAGIFAFAATSIFMLIPRPPDWWIPVVLYLILGIVVFIVIRSWSGRRGWGDWHRLALAGGALMTYAWHGFPQPSVDLGNSALDLIGNAIFAAVAVILIVVAAKRLQTAGSEFEA